MNYEARPTEYNGITFRSKSEAIVARGFDIAGALWTYEPSIYDINGNNVFKVCRKEAKNYRFGLC